MRRRWSYAHGVVAPCPSASWYGGITILLHHWCVRFLGSPDEADDIVQEVFLDAYQALPGFRGDCRLNTWLFTIAKFKVSKLIQERSRRDRHQTLFSTYEFDVGEIADARPTQEEEFIRP